MTLQEKPSVHEDAKLEAGDTIISEKQVRNDPRRHWNLDEGDEHVRYRRNW